MHSSFLPVPINFPFIWFFSSSMSVILQPGLGSGVGTRAGVVLVLQQPECPDYFSRALHPPTRPHLLRCRRNLHFQRKSMYRSSNKSKSNNSEQIILAVPYPHLQLIEDTRAEFEDHCLGQTSHCANRQHGSHTQNHRAHRS